MYVAENNIGVEGAKAIGKALRLSGGSLCTLVLDNNRTDDVLALAEALQITTTLRSLSLKDCGLGPQSATALAAALRRGSLDTLDLSGKPII